MRLTMAMAFCASAIATLDVSASAQPYTWLTSEEQFNVLAASIPPGGVFVEDYESFPHHHSYIPESCAPSTQASFQPLVSRDFQLKSCDSCFATCTFSIRTNTGFENPAYGPYFCDMYGFQGSQAPAVFHFSRPINAFGTYLNRFACCTLGQPEYHHVRLTIGETNQIVHDFPAIPAGVCPDLCPHAFYGVYSTEQFSTIKLQYVGAGHTAMMDGTKYFKSGPRTYVLAVGVRDAPSGVAGDLNAQAVSGSMAHWAFANDRQVLVLDTLQSGNAATLAASVSNFANRVRPGDTFVFYINTHGFFDSTGTEPLQYAEMCTRGQPCVSPYPTVATTGNERLHLTYPNSSPDNISDDQLRAMFAGPQWASVNKLFMIDTCYSGGFIPDLSSLPKTAVIAAAREDKFASARQYDIQQPLYQGVLGHSIARVLSSQQPGAMLSFFTLFGLANVEGAKYNGQPGRLEQEWPGAGAWLFDLPIAFSPVMSIGIDVDSEWLSAQAPPGDVNKDGLVNVDDLVAVIIQWGFCPPPCPPHCSADVFPANAGDCAVNVDDLLTVLTNWLVPRPPRPPDPPVPSNGDSVVAWGGNTEGQCNVPNPNIRFAAVSAGAHHSLGLKKEGSIVAWGANTAGQCNVPSPNAGFTAIAAGGNHSLALRADGSIVAWGQFNTVPAPNSGFTAIAAGTFHSLALRSDGSIVAWGNNSFGQCNVPTPNTGFTRISGGWGHSLGLRSDGSIVAWGNNASGQCNVPAPNNSFVAIAAGTSNHSLGLKSNGSIAAWGSNEYGQCNIPTPNGGFTAAATGFFHGLGLKTDGSIVTWGENAQGQGNVPLPNSGFTALSAGERHSLALKPLP